DTASTLLLLQTAVSLVLLITCANVANLMLVRSAVRSREFAVRAALGAGRWRILQQLVIEGVLLASGGGILGVLMATWSIGVVASFLPANISRSLRGADGASIDLTVIGFAAAITLAATVLFSLAPAIHTLRLDLISRLRDSRQDVTPGRQWA